MSKTIRVATDVGGTFTDLVGIEFNNGKQSIVTAKTDSTPPNFEDGVLNVINNSGINEKDITNLTHGSTVIINALTEKKGAKVGFITTKGFKDILEIARGDRPNYFDMFYKKPKPFVARHLCHEIDERIDYKGNVISPLKLDNLENILNYFKKENVEAIAISFLHSYLNPDHEKKTEEAISKLSSEFFISCAHKISREWREYERSNTSVLSAYVKPVADKYLSSLKSSLSKKGYEKPIYVMQSNCGITTFDRAQEMPISMVESGPSSGVWGAAELGKLVQQPNIIALDIGGTTAKCSLIQNGEVSITSDYWIDRSRTSSGYPIMVPVVDIVEIGNGGGSIAWLDNYDKMHVGPKSAGANPGPVAYGKGGKEPTTTDANLYLGRINKDYFCGGNVNADMDSVENSLSKIGKKINKNAKEVAQGIVRIANHNMTNALKLISLNRGFDPRDFTLLAFGGGGGMHAMTLARELGIKKVVIPFNAAVFSALGMLLSDFRRDYIETILLDFNEESINSLNLKIKDVSKRAIEEFKLDRIGEEETQLKFRARLRYRNQEHFVEVDIKNKIDNTEIETIKKNFHETYEREYTYRLDSPIEFVALHCIAIVKENSKILPDREEKTTKPPKLFSERDVDYDEYGIHNSSIYRGEDIDFNAEFKGPAIIEESGTTIVIFPGDKVIKDGFGNYQITIGSKNE